MPKYVIERNVPGAAAMTAGELQAVLRQSCDVLAELGPRIQWQHSYVTDDKVYCVYIASDAALIRDHAEQSRIPADRVSRVTAVIDPVTAE